ncbi:hypothetical protein MnTg03_00179 [bacterium MnTg03]|nr:hypothetical protein MnTg03_00179 [bacterium MnTg03]
MGESDLVQVSDVGPYDLNIPRLDTSAEEQVVETIVFTALVPDTLEHTTEITRYFIRVDVADRLTSIECEMMNPV